MTPEVTSDVDRKTYWDLLETPLHLALSPSHRLMRVLHPVVSPEALFVRTGQPEMSKRRAVGAQLVGDQQFRRKSLLFEQLAHQSQGRQGVAPALNKHVEDLAFVVNGTPEVHPLAGDPEQHLASRAGESHPHALPEPYVTISSHTAPDVRPFACRKRQ
jgi:hypothetical protein